MRSITRARLGQAAAAVAAAALATRAATSTAKPPAPVPLRESVRISFSGEGRQTLDACHDTLTWRGTATLLRT